MFVIDDKSVELTADMPGKLQSISEENGHEDTRRETTPREMTTHERKELERRYRSGKISGSKFDAKELGDERDVIRAGDAYPLIQKADEKNVELRGLSDDDQRMLKERMLLENFDTGIDGKPMISEPIRSKIKKRFDLGPTVIQQFVVPLILCTTKDIVARAKTGSGKSAAFLLPIIQKIHEKKLAQQKSGQKAVNATSPHAVVFEPTRELCLQVAKEARRLSDGTEVKVTFSYGSIDMDSTYGMMKLGADIIVGTPSRLSHLFFGIEKNTIHKECFDLKNLEYLVLDESDRLIELPEFSIHIAQFKSALNDQEIFHRTFMFSATGKRVEVARKLYVHTPVEVSVGGDEAPVRNVVQRFVKFDPTKTNIVQYKKTPVNCPHAKIDYLMFFFNRSVTGTDEEGYKRVPKTIVFVETRRSSDCIAIWLLRNNFRATVLNSDRTVETRLNATRGIQRDHYDIIVATDVLARGVNVPGVKNIINYDLPLQSPVNYVHRLGRTGRMGNIGRVISFFNVVKDASMAPLLEKWLVDNDQPVPAFLREVSSDSTLKLQEHLIIQYQGQPLHVPLQPRQILDEGIEF